MRPGMIRGQLQRRGALAFDFLNFPAARLPGQLVMRSGRAERAEARPANGPPRASSRNPFEVRHTEVVVGVGSGLEPSAVSKQGMASAAVASASRIPPVQPGIGMVGRAADALAK